MTGILQDIHYAFRALRKSPVFLVTALLLLAAGTGVNALIFSVVDSVLLRPLPYSNPQQLYLLWESSPLVHYSRDLAVTTADFVEIKKNNRVFESIAALRAADFNLTSTDQPQRVSGARISADLFSVLGVQPALGRNFKPEEEQAGNDNVVIISNALWRRRFSSAPDVIGKTLRLDETPYLIIGVMPAGFDFPRGSEMPAIMRFGAATEIWKPLGLTLKEYSDRASFRYAVLGRTKSGISLAQATSDLGAIIQSINGRQTRVESTVTAKLVPLHESMVRDVRSALMLLWLASFFVLATSAFNVANLLMARSVVYRREIAVRAALGAGRWRLIQQLLVENLILTVGGGLIGFALAAFLLRFLIALGPTDLPRLNGVQINIQVFLATLLLSIFTALAFGLIPATAGFSGNLEQTLRSGGVTHTRVGARTQKTLMGIQLSISLVLVTCALLVGISFAKLLHVQLGFTTDNVLTMEIPLTPSQYAKPTQRKDFFESVIQIVQHLPGVTTAGVIDSLPLSGGGQTTNTTFRGQPCNAGDELAVEYRYVSPDYFHVMGIPLDLGRTFVPQDSSDSTAIINETFAHQCWPNQDATGKQFKTGRGDEGPWLTVIGIVKDVRNSSPAVPPRPQSYLPYFDTGFPNMTLVVKTSIDPRSLIGPVQRGIWAVDKHQPVDKIRTMRQLFSEGLARQRFEFFLFISFALIAVGLACAGVYGTTSYSAAQRTFEMGIRMAFGANRGHLFRLILNDALRPALLAVLAGSFASLIITHFMESELFEIKSNNPVVLISVSALMIALAIIASCFPARRASAGDPIRTLRQE